MTEKHLLFAVLAFEGDLIDLAQLTAACRAWVADKSKPIADLLVERGWITAEDRGFVEKQLERKLAKHQHDPRVTLNSVVRGDVCDAIKEVDDSDIQQSLSSWPSSGPVLIETIGETLGEPEQPKSRYTWVSEVGKGGLGKIWLARDNDLAREVALKEVKPGSASTEAVRRLIKEAQITGQLQHPNIVPVYEVNRGGRPFYTMKLVKGETLSKAIRRHHEQSRAGHEDPLSLPRLLNVFVNVCEALAYAHSRGIIHRDLKPENIVLGDYGEAIVLDWGLAKQIGSADEETAPVVLTDDAQSQATRQGATPGTPAYMSPEQAAGRVDLLDHRTDIYGLGTILFEILTGHPPHRIAPVPPATGLAPVVPALLHYPNSPAPNPAEDEVVQKRGNHPDERGGVMSLLQRISEAPTPRARDVDPTISRELDAVCATAMSKKRDERYLDAKALAADVKRSLAHQPVSVYRTGAWERLRLWRRRNPVVAALSLFLAVTLLTGSVVSTLFGLAANRAEKRANIEASNAIASQQKESKQRILANRRADEALLNLYIANIRMAATEWEAAHIDNMNASLEATRPKPGDPDIRNWEWHYLWNLSHSELFTLDDHPYGVACVSFSPDGKRIVSGGATVKVWDAESGQETLTCKAQSGLMIENVAFSLDGKRIVGSDFYTNSVMVWDAENGLATLMLKGHTNVSRVRFAPDGKRIVVDNADSTITVWDVERGQETLKFKGDFAIISQDGRRIAGRGNNTVTVWDAVSGQELLAYKGQSEQEVFRYAFSPDAKRIVFVSAGVDNTVQVWDIDSGQKLLTQRGSSAIFSPDGKQIVSQDNHDRHSVTVWDAESGQVRLALKGHSGPVSSVSFSPDGKRIVTGSEDTTVKEWDATSGRLSHTFIGHSYDLKSVAFSPNGSRIMSYDGLTAKVWDAYRREEPAPRGEYTLTNDGSSLTQASFSPNGKQIVCGSSGNTVKVWDTEDGQVALTLSGHSDQVSSVVFSPNGKQIISGSHDGTVKVWDASNGHEMLTFKGHSTGRREFLHSDGVTRVIEYQKIAVSSSPDGKWIVSGGDDTVKVWDAVSGKVKLNLLGHSIGGGGTSDGGGVRRSHRNGVESLAFSADGKWVASGSADETVKVWDADNGQLKLTLKKEYGASCVSFSPDGKRIVSGGYKEITVWDAESGQETLSLKGHTGLVSSVSFSPDGQRIISAGRDKMLKVWEAKSGQVLLTLQGHSNFVSSASFSPDGKWIVSTDYGIKIWNGSPKSK